MLIYLPIATLMQRSGTPLPYTEIHGWVLLPIAVALLLGLPLFARGATLGQLLTHTRPMRKEGGQPGIGSRLLRFVSGSGGYFLIVSLSEITGYSFLNWLATTWLVIAGAAVLLWHPRGISGLAARLTVGDARDPELHTSQAQRVDPRSLGVAVLAAIFTVVLAWRVFAEISALAPAVGLALAVLVVGALALVTLGLVPYLVVVGIATIRREQVSLSTLLPLLTAIALVGLFLGLIVGFVTTTAWLFVLAAAGSALSGYLGSVFFAFLLYGQWYARRSPETPVDAVVVLGSRVFGDQVPPLLATRIDRGIEVLDELLIVDPDSPIVLVCSGGRGSDEDIAEGEAMARYARDHGAPAQRVLVEDQSRNTEENLRFTRSLLATRGLGSRMVAVTNDYHAFRTAIISREMQIDAQVIGAPTARYYFPGAIIREFVGVLVRRPFLHGGLALALSSFGAGIALLLIR